MQGWQRATKFGITLGMLAFAPVASADILSVAAEDLASALQSCQSPCTFIVHGDATLPDTLKINAMVDLLGDASRPKLTGPPHLEAIHIEGGGEVAIEGIDVSGGAPAIVVDAGGSLRLRVVTVRPPTAGASARPVPWSDPRSGSSTT
jgi:hypothetical protein